MLEVKQVSKSFGSKLALRDFSCTLEPGEIYGLLGANGSGKTTLMKLIANLILPDRGQILLDGQEVKAALFGYDGQAQGGGHHGAQCRCHFARRALERH